MRYTFKDAKIDSLTQHRQHTRALRTSVKIVRDGYATHDASVDADMESRLNIYKVFEILMYKHPLAQTFSFIDPCPFGKEFHIRSSLIFLFSY